MQVRYTIQLTLQWDDKILAGVSLCGMLKRIIDKELDPSVPGYEDVKLVDPSSESMLHEDPVRIVARRKLITTQKWENIS